MSQIKKIEKIEKKSHINAVIEKEIMEERAIEIEKINKKASQLNEIMISLSAMVEYQGENISEIKESTKKSTEHTKKGLGQLKIAEEGGSGWKCVIS